jgi:hypothetical protein
VPPGGARAAIPAPSVSASPKAETPQLSAAQPGASKPSGPSHPPPAPGKAVPTDGALKPVSLPPGGETKPTAPPMPPPASSSVPPPASRPAHLLGSQEPAKPDLPTFRTPGDDKDGR